MHRTNFQTILLRHHAMLSDPLRTPLLLKAVRKTVKRGDVVLDLGCGTGILSFAAAIAGAKKVHACDVDEAIHFARAEAEKLGLNDRIKFHRTLSFDLKFPGKADIIIAETVGGLGFDENIVPSVYDARRRFLKKGGKIIPGRLKVFLAPVRAGTKISKARKRGRIIDTPLVFTKITPKDLLAPGQLYHEVNFETEEAIGFDHELEFRAKRSGTLKGFAGWFEVEWAPGIFTNTAPNHPLTHWKQTFLPVQPQPKIKKGSTIFFRLRIYPKGGLYSTESAIEWGFAVQKER